jgi:hypothetical protein
VKLRCLLGHIANFLPVFVLILGSEALADAGLYVKERDRRGNSQRERQYVYRSIEEIQLTERIVHYLCGADASGGMTVLETPFVEVFFRSSVTPPESGLRVRIRNTTPGFTDHSVPYTDRGYNSDKVSEKIHLLAGDRHSTRYFMVLASQHGTENQFEFEIYSSTGILEAGTFSLPSYKTVLPARVVWNDPSFCRWQPNPPVLPPRK